MNFDLSAEPFVWRIDEAPNRGVGGALGRHVEHDPRSLLYPAQTAPLVTTAHQRHAPIFDQGDLGDCVPPGTRVRLADGSEVPIEDVRLLDEVVTAEGRTGRVTATMVRDEDGGLIRVALWGHAHLRMTRNHPVLTRRGYVPAGELRIGDEVALPRYLGRGATHVDVASFVDEPAFRVTREFRRQGLPGRRGLVATAKALPEKIELTPGAGRLIGLFLAEGSIDKSKASWCFGAHERDTLVAETTALLKQEWDVEAVVRERPHNVIVVTVYGTGWARLLRRLCADDEGDKRPHPVLMSGPRPFQEAMLDGWLDGDGWHVGGARRGVTVSRDLALAMYDIAQAVGRRPTIDHRESPQNRHAATRRPRWTIGTATETSRNYSTQDDRHVWRKVRELRVEDFVGPVYNLSVEGDESYVAEGIGVHNCTTNAALGAMMCDPFFAKAEQALGHVAAEQDCVSAYSWETAHDGFAGAYPPDDTGSSGLAAGKTMKHLGLCRTYRHAFGLPHVLGAIVVSPGILGLNWYESMDHPDANGFVTVGGAIRGGHEVCIDTINVESQYVEIANSWGTSWGLNGRFRMTWKTLGAVLADQGDFVQFVQ